LPVSQDASWNDPPETPTLHWKLMCSRFSPPISGGAPNSVGPKTIDKFEIDIEFLDSWRRILRYELVFCIGQGNSLV
jgi:hypothetical protein